MNPVQEITEESPNKAATDDTVTDYRVALVECDEGSIEDQWSALIKMKLPVIATTHSGNKSLHVLCRIDAGADKNLYKKRVAALYEYVSKHRLNPDAHCKNPSHLTRFPGCMREGKMQYVVSWNWGYADWASFEAEELHAPTASKLGSGNSVLLE